MKLIDRDLISVVQRKLETAIDLWRLGRLVLNVVPAVTCAYRKLSSLKDGRHNTIGIHPATLQWYSALTMSFPWMLRVIFFDYQITSRYQKWNSPPFQYDAFTLERKHIQRGLSSKPRVINVNADSATPPFVNVWTHCPIFVHDQIDLGSFHWHLAKGITPSELGSAVIGITCIRDPSQRRHYRD